MVIQSASATAVHVQSALDGPDVHPAGPAREVEAPGILRQRDRAFAGRLHHFRALVVGQDGAAPHDRVGVGDSLELHGAVALATAARLDREPGIFRRRRPRAFTRGRRRRSLRFRPTQAAEFWSSDRDPALGHRCR